MPLSSLISAGVEFVSNHYLDLDKQSAQRIKSIVGKVIALDIQPFPTIYFNVATDSLHLDVLTQYEGIADSYLKLSVWSVPKLKDPNILPELIRSGDVELTGDIRLIQQFSEVFSQVKPEPEEKLSALIGDVPANLFFRQLKRLNHGLNQFFQQNYQHLSEVAVEEWHLVVGGDEYRDWCDDINQLEKQLETLEQRINRL
ncbi:MAG: Ubiquinone biosynthesis accessory factor UbiJ [Candidatus Celerinatantimonas neptuna]|nr:MAG: Ubiquinone biosynthesis accessory factor UbiJ [Candidatus Celerinatantimonas neptuna]